MVYELLRFVCILVGVAGLLLGALELLARLDRTLLWGGILLVLLALLVGVDVWVLPGTHDGRTQLPWLRFQHELGFAITLILTVFYRQLCGWEPRLPQWLYMAWCICTAVLLLTDTTIRLRDGELHTTSVYMATMLVTYVYLAYIIGGSLIHAYREGADRQLVLRHVAGFGILVASGVADSAVLWTLGLFRSPLPSFSVIGTLAFSVVLNASFLDRFAALLQERKDTYLRIRAAYRQLESALPWRELAEASGMVNHEISNNAFLLSDNIHALRRYRGLSGKAQEIVFAVERQAASLRAVRSAGYAREGVGACQDQQPR
ncbi:MAG: hypothetical protein GF331_14345 [Chitinivibrionales bacterium]|nr:hypothetical protein [Chitinivibrionales bacterium]